MSVATRLTYLLLAGTVLVLSPLPAVAATSDYAVKVGATVEESPPAISFTWAADAEAEYYRIYRKSLEDTVWSGPVAVLEGDAVAWTDTDVSVGDAFEYSFRKAGGPVFDTVSVASGTPVTFTIHDSYGDGIYGENGFGYYRVSACDTLCASGGDFGLEESASFTVEAVESPCYEVIVEVMPDIYGIETTWELTEDAGGDTLGRGGPYGSPKYSHVFAGIKYAAPETWGTVLLLVDGPVADSLEMEIDRLELDLICDGYRVRRHDIADAAEVPAVKTLIMSECLDRPEISTVFLLGNIAVPYSGDIHAAHSDHYGAWAADLYYGELDGPWTDSYVNNTTADRVENHNVPGDGKFDQTFTPSDVDLMIGRVDLSRMTYFAESEIDLLRRYLDKDHAFRTGGVDVARRGIIDDNVGEAGGPAFACSGWRNFCAMFGRDKTTPGNYIPTLQSSDYLWAYGCGSSSYWHCGGVAGTLDFASMDFYAVFTMLFGSYFGDWDIANSVLRAPLGNAGYPLTCCWAGRPTWHLHHMALGYPIGYSTRVTQNNATLYMIGPGSRRVHAALMGDPTLRMHPVSPPTGLVLEEGGGGTVHLAWSAPPDSAVIGYHVYRADSLYGEFTRANTYMVQDTTYDDSGFSPCSVVYMVRAVKLETSRSGTYLNLSPGVIDSIEVNAGVEVPETPARLLYVTSPFSDITQVRFHLAKPGDVSLRVFNVAGRLVRSVEAEGLGEGTHTLTWDARDAAGKRVASGVYFMVISSGEAAVSCKTVLLE